MKKRLMILFAVAVATACSGCRHMPDWALKEHVDVYNALHEDNPIEADNGLETRHGTD